MTFGDFTAGNGPVWRRCRPMTAPCPPCTVAGATARRSHCVETGAATEESPGWRPGGFFCWSAGGGRAEVEMARLRIREEGGERGPPHDVRPGFGALAIADRHHLAEVGYFHTSAVVLAAAGLPPGCVRQVSHRGYSVCRASCLR